MEHVGHKDFRRWSQIRSLKLSFCVELETVSGKRTLPACYNLPSSGSYWFEVEQQDETSLGPETSQASGLILYLIESCQKALQLSFPGPENSLDITQVTGLSKWSGSYPAVLCRKWDTDGEACVDLSTRRGNGFESQRPYIIFKLVYGPVRDRWWASWCSASGLCTSLSLQIWC